MCQVCDAAEACRNVHSDPVWRRAAGVACADLGAYLAEVNQHYGMYAKLRDTMDRWAGGVDSRTDGGKHPAQAPDSDSLAA
jgi:intermediate peptidase